MNALPYSFKQFSTECRSVSVIPMVSIGNWSRKLASLSQPIRCKCNINYDLVACVFPRFRQCGCLNFEFSLVLFLSSDWPISFSFSLRHSIKRRFKSQGKVIDDDTITRQFTWGGAMDDTDDMDDLIEMDWWKIKANQISAFNELCACCATETDPLSLEVVIKWCHFTWQIHSHERLKENLLYKAETFSSRMAIRSEIWAAEKMHNPTPNSQNGSQKKCMKDSAENWYSDTGNRRKDTYIRRSSWGSATRTRPLILA